MSDTNQLHHNIRSLLSAEQWDQAAAILNTQKWEDVTDILEHVSEESLPHIFALLDADLKADVLAGLEGEVGEDIMESLTNAELAELVEEMAPDDAADVLADLPEERSEVVLGLMEKEESDDVRELLQYEEDTAGGIMTTDVFSFDADMTVREVINQISSSEDDDEPFYYTYVVDESNLLIGYITLWQLLKVRDTSTKLRDIAERDIETVPVDMDQENVARLMSKYDLTAIPVIDNASRLVGRITVDDVMDVMEEEASEDIFRLAGSNDAELSTNSALMACKSRLPWLLITLMTGFITSGILKQFMADLSHVLVLSFFVPIVMAMGGNTGIQSSTLIIRGIALGRMEGRRIMKVLSREIMIGAFMGLFCGLIIGIWARYLIASDHQQYPPLFLASTVSLSLMTAMTFAAMFGAFVPILLDKFKIDPAVASGPFVTASNDIFALLIYYGVAISLITGFYRFTGTS